MDNEITGNSYYPCTITVNDGLAGNEAADNGLLAEETAAEEPTAGEPKA